MHDLPLRCPGCGSHALSPLDDGLRCDRCSRVYPIRDGKLYLIETDESVVEHTLDRLKYRFKRFRRFYAFLVWLISPLYFDGTRRRFIGRRVRGRDGVFLNLGSGNTLLDPRVVNIDITPYDSVDVVSDLLPLPFQDASIDGVFSISVLEHVPDPERVLREIRRVLKPGGFVYTDVPFVVGYHASPRDYYRWTREGLEQLHHGFRTERIVQNGGPTSALLWVFQEWVAILLSFGSRKLHTAIYVLVMVLTFPIKFLDVFLKRVDLGANISSCFIYIGTKVDD